MSRNGKNFKTQISNFLLKTMFKHSSDNNNYNLSPLNAKKENSITSIEYLTFHTNESANKSNKIHFKKNKSIHLPKKHSKIKDNNTNCQSIKITKNNSKKKNLLLNKTNIKRCSSTSKTILNSLNSSNNFSKKCKIKEKKNNKIIKLFEKEQEDNRNKTKKNSNKKNYSKKLIKNKSINNIHTANINNFFNMKKLSNINNLSNNITINNNTMNKNQSNNNNFNHAHKNKNYFNNNTNIKLSECLFNSSKSKKKNICITTNNIDNNINNNILYINNITKPNANKNIQNKKIIHKTCINTPIESSRKIEYIIQLNKDIEVKDKEINNLKNIINEKDLYIKDLENKISTLNINKNVDEEYEKYSKIIMLNNVKNLTAENEELNKQIKDYKKKEIKMLSLLENMNKKGIDINHILNLFDKEEKNLINNNSINTNERIIKYDEIVLKTDATNTTNNTNNTFLPLNLNDEQKNISYKSCINLNQKLPGLQLKNINEYYNDNYYAQKKNENDNIKIQILNKYDCNIIKNNS